MIEKYINIKEFVEKTNTSMNIKYDDLLEYITETGDKCGGLMPTLYEKRLLKTGQEMVPELKFVHPKNDCHLGDIYSPVINDGIEVKVCVGRTKLQNGKKYEHTVWENGSVQSHIKKFLFIDTRVVNCKLVIKRIFFGELSYKEWTPHLRKGIASGMFIGPRKLKKLCEQGLCKQII